MPNVQNRELPLYVMCGTCAYFFREITSDVKIDIGKEIKEHKWVPLYSLLGKITGNVVKLPHVSLNIRGCFKRCLSDCDVRNSLIKCMRNSDDLNGAYDFTFYGIQRGKYVFIF